MDRRLFVGVVFVIGVQGLVWLVFSVMSFGAGGTTADFLGATLLGFISLIPFVVAAMIIGLGPGVALWIGLMAVFRRTHISERKSALLAAPAVALAVSVICLFAILYGLEQNLRIDSGMVIVALIFSAPAAIAAEIYAYWAWATVAKHEEDVT